MTNPFIDPSKNELDQLTISGLDSPSDRDLTGDEAERVLQDSPRVSYEDKFVAFIDLLGFRQIVMRSSKHNGAEDEREFKKHTIEEVHGALSSIPHDDYAAYFRPRYLGQEHDVANLGLGVAGFSDTLIFWSDVTPEAFGLLIYAVFRTVREFTLRGFYCRGGIKLGELLIDNTGFENDSRSTPVLFGPAFISAYDLERRNANEARVILCNESTRRLISYCNDAKAPLLRRFFAEFLYQAKDGPWQIDIFSDFHHPNVDEKGALISQANMISSKLKSVLEEYTESPNVYRKLLSVAKALNQALGVGGKLIPELVAYVVVIPTGR